MYLLDTHTLLWWAQNDHRLSDKVRKILSDDEQKVFCSAVSLWEIAIKVKLKKLTIPLTPLQFVTKLVEEYDLQPLQISFLHAAEIYDLPTAHADPFDRLLISQARIEKLKILTDDQQFLKYEVDCLW
jgi:PIN domain nuclease of toxin-antitoxin system